MTTTTIDSPAVSLLASKADALPADLVEALRAKLPPGSLQDAQTVAIRHINAGGSVGSSKVTGYLSAYRRWHQHNAAKLVKQEAAKAVATTVKTASATTSDSVRTIALSTGTAYAPANLPSEYDAIIAWTSGKFWSDLYKAMDALGVPRLIQDALTTPRAKKDGTMSKGDFNGAVATVLAFSLAKVLQGGSK